MMQLVWSTGLEQGGYGVFVDVKRVTQTAGCSTVNVPYLKIPNISSNITTNTIDPN